MSRFRAIAVTARESSLLKIKWKIKKSRGFECVSGLERSRDIGRRRRSVCLCGRFSFIIFNAQLFTVLVQRNEKGRQKASDTEDGSFDIRLACLESGEVQIHKRRNIFTINRGAKNFKEEIYTYILRSAILRKTWRKINLLPSLFVSGKPQERVPSKIPSQMRYERCACPVESQLW